MAGAEAPGSGIGKGAGVGFAIQRIDLDPKAEPRRSGFEDIHLNAKYQFLEEHNYLPASALALDLKVPTASQRKGLTSGKTMPTSKWERVTRRLPRSFWTPP